ncbi:peptidase U32 family protein [Motilimonas eburnea]|uniref:peptidase U32 family protein n=1 Tax=Motilimonas eburnea TaxID=1737488 RepID=UPI001E45753A|nr:peptidase U32 family protein [Motilimonas eburnea]MCE2571890.1 U32 family peptidase [Motilimonas eburnea]
MKPKIELLAPGGDIDAIKAAIIAGADAVYCGLDSFNARNRAANISFDELVGAIRLAHQYDCQIFLTLNIVILEHEFKSLVKLLNRLVNTTLDGVIVQDLGLLYVLRRYFPSLDIHASTQLTTHNAGQIPFLRQLGASRVNLSRELNLREITALAEVGKAHDTLLEVFVHGSLCIAFSGLCYSTSASAGNSGNRGRCSQACREEYETTEAGNNFPLNIKDNSAFFDLPALIKAGVYSFKVEGRIKGASYVHTVIDSFRKQIDGYVETGELTQDGERLYKVFNRDFTNAFLRGDLNQNMFIDNPRDHAKSHAVDKLKAAHGEEISVVQIFDAKKQLHADKQQINATVDEKVAHLTIEKAKLTLHFVAEQGQPLTLTATTAHPKGFISGGEIELQTQTFYSASPMLPSEKLSVDAQALNARFKNIANAHYELVELDTSQVPAGLSIPYREVTELKNALLTYLNEGASPVNEVTLPKLERYAKARPEQTELSLLICDPRDAALANITDADIYFKLPDAYKRGCTKYVDLLLEHPRLIPWFPPVLIGKDFDVALNILEQVKPDWIVTNNTGIAYHAHRLGINWIAGPLLNTTNSYALLALQQGFDCRGAFISNEISKKQIRHIARPDNFKLFYSVYHPILLMASRQCFFQQSVGCEKPRIDNGCMLSCDKSTSIKNLKGDSFAIDKQKGGYPSIYNQDQFLNTDIIDDLKALFDGFMIDLTNIGAGDKPSPDKVSLIKHFEAMLSGQTNASEQIAQLVPASTNQQYQVGL